MTLPDYIAKLVRLETDNARKLRYLNLVKRRAFLASKIHGFHADKIPEAWKPRVEWLENYSSTLLQALQVEQELVKLASESQVIYGERLASWISRNITGPLEDAEATARELDQELKELGEKL